MVRKNAVQHGTPQGYKKHLQKSSGWAEPCDECRAANNQAMQEYRERTGRDRSQDNRRRTARQRALNRLAKENPDRTHELINQELQKMEASR